MTSLSLVQDVMVADFAVFDHFCDVLEVPTAMAPVAFAAWLGSMYSWDGNYQQAEDKE